MEESLVGKTWNVATHLNILKIPWNSGPSLHIFDSETVQTEVEVCITHHKEHFKLPTSFIKILTLNTIASKIHFVSNFVPC
jgi:hypothetical protein